MTLVLDKDYSEALRSAKPTYIPQRTIRPPKGVLGAITVIPPQTIPPLNTNIQFNILPSYKPAEHPGLAAIETTTLPENFNWKKDGKEKSKWIADAGNQMLCGSCWAISAAGVIADNFVVSGYVQWKPYLSTTWCLACYPQNRCQGGNPAQLLTDISRGGIATDNCIDYSWCSEDPRCSGSATKHFEAKDTTNLSTLVPSCGCYDSSVPHYLFSIKNPQMLAINQGNMNETIYFSTIKKHIFKNGPVLGGYLVFQNFRSGAFTKLNGGVYLENFNYDNGEFRYDESQTNPDKYIGSHAVAVLGWGVAKGIIVDGKGTRKDVPYWYCRNSWTDKWGDRGYFKMAMYPYNRMSQFDKTVIIQAKGSKFGSGGMVLFNVDSPPKMMTLKQLSKQFLDAKRARKSEFYSTEMEDVHGTMSRSGTRTSSTLTRVAMVLGLVLALVFLVRFLMSSRE